MKKITISLIITTILLSSINGTKYWTGSVKFENSEKWEQGLPPCPNDKIVFPEQFSSVMYLPDDLKTSGLILPENGALLLHEDMQITFPSFKSSKSENRNCVNKNGLAKMKTPKLRSWFDPENWRENPGEHQNPATPHVNRIPCSNEKVIINNVSSIDLEEVDVLAVGYIYMEHRAIRTRNLELFLRTELGQTVFQNSEYTKLWYDSGYRMCGCHLSDLLKEYEWKVCRFSMKTCTIPQCVEPITPVGHCCPVCGSVLKLFLDRCLSFESQALKRKLKSLQHDRGFTDQLDVDVNIVNYNKNFSGAFAQIVVLDRDPYHKRSLEFIDVVKDFIRTKQSYNSLKQIVQSSGSYYSPSSTKSAWFFVFSSLFGVLAFFAVIFAHFVPEKSLITLPSWVYPSRYKIFNSPFVFARFENYPQDDVEGAIVVEVISDDNLDAVEPEIAVEEGEEASGFDNPMFDNSTNTTDNVRGPRAPDTDLSEIELMEK